VYDVHQPWISAGLPQDPWLHFWNAPSLPFLEQSKRAMLEASGERGRLESAAPTRPIGIDRHPIFGDEESRSKVPPGSVSTFHFNRIYFASQSLKKEALNAGFSVGHGEVIYPGISTSTFIGEIKPAKATVTKMLVISDLDEQCGVMTALQALKKLRAAKVAASMSIFGRGATRYMAEVRSFVVTHQLPVEFLNVSNVNTDLPAIYKKHDLFLYTAESQEGFPDAILEAMACGLPVIGAYHRGTEEFLRHGENSFAFTPGDADALAACMQSLQVSPALRCQMAETAQEEVMSQFNESASLEKIENYLNASVEGRGSEA